MTVLKRSRHYAIADGNKRVVAFHERRVDWVGNEIALRVLLVEPPGYTTTECLERAAGWLSAGEPAKHIELQRERPCRQAARAQF